MFLLTETPFAFILILSIGAASVMTNQENKANQEIREICEVISKLKNKKEIETLLNELLTPSEMSDVTQRWNILKMLNKQDSQRKIAKNLSVSLCKVTRGSKIFKNEKSLIRQILFDESWRG